MKYRNNPSVRSFQQPFDGQSQGQGHGQGLFPGISDNWFGGNNSIGMNSVPFDSQQFQPNTPAVQIQPSYGNVIPLPQQQQLVEAAAPAKSGGGFSLPATLHEIKGIVDRMGGIDNIVATMTKVQKVVSSMSQMAPLIKVLAGSFGKKGAAATIAQDVDGAAKPRPKKRRRRTGSGAGVTPGGARHRTKPRRR